MKKEERIALCIPVLLIQFFDSLPGEQQERFVLRQYFLRRVRKIGQQPEVQVFIAICQKPDFHRLDQIFDVGSTREERWDHHQGARFLRNSFGEIHPRQRMRRHQQCSQPVHQRHRHLASTQHRKESRQREQPIRVPTGMRHEQQAPCENRCHQGDRAEIEEQGKPAACFSKKLRNG